jgi:hypothetical protein
MFIRIQFIRLIYCFLFSLADDIHDLQLATKDVYEARVHVSIHGHTHSW